MTKSAQKVQAKSARRERKNKIVMDFYYSCAHRNDRVVYIETHFSFEIISALDDRWADGNKRTYTHGGKKTSGQKEERKETTQNSDQHNATLLSAVFFNFSRFDTDTNCSSVRAIAHKSFGCVRIYIQLFVASREH